MVLVNLFAAFLVVGCCVGAGVSATLGFRGGDLENFQGYVIGCSLGALAAGLIASLFFQTTVVDLKNFIGALIGAVVAALYLHTWFNNLGEAPFLD